MNIKKIKFYLSRIKSMSARELISRLRWKIKLDTYYKLSSLNSKRQFKLPFGKLRQNFYSKHFYFESSDNIPENNKSENNKSEKDKPKNSKNAAQNHKLLLKTVVQKADSLLVHHIPIYEINKNLGTEINWNKDYKHETVWPPEFIGKIHHADTKYSDIRYIWELNRCAHLVDLGKAYYFSKNDSKEKYAQEIVEQINSWIEQNPYLRTVNWFSGLELGVRIINWIIALKLIKNSSVLDQEKLNKIISSLYLQAEFIYNNLSKYSSANNHLIGELAAIKIISTVFPDLPKAKEWKNKSSKLLNKEILRQIYIDGVGKEQSVNYLLFDLELYYLSSVAVHEEIKPEIKDRIAKCQDFLSHLLINKKELPSIGDSDDAKFSLSPFTEPFLSSFLSSDLKNKLTESKLFPSGGYFISKNKEKAHLIFDCGPLGYLSTSGHGHCDTLSFILSVNRKIFFSDPGTYVYHGNPEWRNYFKSTEAHNTIKIDGKNQSEITGAFIYGKKANPKIINSKISENEDAITAYHEGYKDVGIIHERKLIHNKKKREITIVDSIISKKNDCKKNNEKEHSLSLFFNLHPEVKLKKINQNEYFLTNHNTKIKLILDQNLPIQEHYGETNPILGWNSLKFGVKVPSLCLEGQTKITTTTHFKTMIEY